MFWKKKSLIKWRFYFGDRYYWYHVEINDDNETLNRRLIWRIFLSCSITIFDKTVIFKNLSSILERSSEIFAENSVARVVACLDYILVQKRISQTVAISNLYVRKPNQAWVFAFFHGLVEFYKLFSVISRFTFLMCYNVTNFSVCKI